MFSECTPMQIQCIVKSNNFIELDSTVILILYLITQDSLCR